MINQLRSKLRGYLARRLGVPSIPFSLERLRKIGFSPDLVFDVGAYRGEFAQLCLRLWPECRVVCFEALENAVRKLRSLAAETEGIEVFDCLLGAAAAERVPLHVCETASSVMSEHHNNVGGRVIRELPMRRIDDIAAENPELGAVKLLKLDVQGYELEVLKGAEQSLVNVEAIVLETNLLDIYKDVPLISEVMRWLETRGFVAYDICGLTRRPLDQALWQADVLFVPLASGLRSDKRWAAN